MNKNILLVLFVVLLCSCSRKEHIEYEYHDDGNTVHEMRVYPDYPNDSTFHTTIYYKNGQIYAEGDVINYRNDGEWKFWFRDGTSQGSIFFNYGIADYGNSKRKLPTIFLLDSLRVGIKTPLQITNLYPEQELIFDKKVRLEPAIGNNFNYEITVFDKDPVSFNYDILTRVRIDSTEFDRLYKKRLIPRYNRTYIYKKSDVKLATFKAQ